MQSVSVPVFSGGESLGKDAAEILLGDAAPVIGYRDANATGHGRENADRDLFAGRLARQGVIGVHEKVDENLHDLVAIHKNGRDGLEITDQLDGIAVVVHPGNPVANLTVEQIKKIYIGEIKNWKDVGGPDQAIVVISRDTSSGTYETFETMVLKGQKLTAKSEYVGSNGAVRQRVMSTPAAIGYVGIAFLEGVKAVKVNDVEVTNKTVADNTYPIARPMYMYTHGHPKEGTPLFDFVNLCNTPEGRKMITEIGFVPKAESK